MGFDKRAFWIPLRFLAAPSRWLLVIRELTHAYLTLLRAIWCFIGVPCAQAGRRVLLLRCVLWPTYSRRGMRRLSRVSHCMRPSSYSGYCIKDYMDSNIWLKFRMVKSQQQRLKIRLTRFYSLSRRFGLSFFVTNFRHRRAEIHCRQVGAGCWLHHVHSLLLWREYTQNISPRFFRTTKTYSDFSACGPCLKQGKSLRHPPAQRAAIDQLVNK